MHPKDCTSSLLTVCVCACVYMCVCVCHRVTGMAPSAGRFFIFLVYMFMMSQMALALFRAIGALTRNYDTANSFGSTVRGHGAHRQAYTRMHAYAGAHAS